MTCHHPDLGSASDWSCRVGNLIQPIRSTTQIWVVTRHQYGISALVDQTPFGGEISSSVAKCRLFSQARTDDNEVMKDNIIWKLHECTLEVNLSFIVFLKRGARVAVSENLQRISIDSA